MKTESLVKFENVLKTYKSKYHGKKALEKYRKWFPLFPSERLAGIIADLMCDGHIQPPKKLRLDYTSKSKKELRRFGKEIYNIFKIKGKIRPCKTNKFGKSYNYGVNCKPLCRLLILCGAPAGNKQTTEFTIPKWILTNKKYFKRFLQRVFSCEGTVSLEDSPFVGIVMYKSLNQYSNGLKFFNDIKKYLFIHFKIETTNIFSEKRLNVRKDGVLTKALKLRIKKTDSLLKFAKFINIEDNQKHRKLEQIVNGAAQTGQ